MAPAPYIERVRTVRSQGAYGGRGYQSVWVLSEAAKDVLRTHTTRASSGMLYTLANQKPVVPARYFSIDGVFRNETLDATHLAEFHQVEGLVADYGLTLGHLKAMIRAFFNKLGLTDLRFKLEYNPYTEPSMEIFSVHSVGHGIRRSSRPTTLMLSVPPCPVVTFTRYSGCARNSLRY
ncbi:unnamed protein product [Dicrocoelium dendriticum]|nr:unnamed protein product [Dicrocoelium dendriticum]